MTIPVTRQWGCIAEPEQQALAYTADYPRVISPLIPDLYFTGLFLVHSPTWWEIRKEQFLTVYGYVMSTITIGEEEIEVWQPPTDWLYDLSDARSEGKCVVGDECCYGRGWRDNPPTASPCEGTSTESMP